MSDAAPPPETPEIVEPEQATVSDPAKLIRLGTMVHTLMAEVRQGDTDEASRHLLARIHRETVEERSAILSPDLMDELWSFGPLRRRGHPNGGVDPRRSGPVGRMDIGPPPGAPGIDGPAAGGGHPATPAPPASTPATGCAAATPRFAVAGADGYLPLS